MDHQWRWWQRSTINDDDDKRLTIENKIASTIHHQWRYRPSTMIEDRLRIRYAWRRRWRTRYARSCGPFLMPKYDRGRLGPVAEPNHHRTRAVFWSVQSWFPFLATFWSISNPSTANFDVVRPRSLNGIGLGLGLLLLFGNTELLALFHETRSTNWNCVVGSRFISPAELSSPPRKILKMGSHFAGRLKKFETSPRAIFNFLQHPRLCLRLEGNARIAFSFSALLFELVWIVGWISCNRSLRWVKTCNRTLRLRWVQIHAPNHPSRACAPEWARTTIK